MRFDYLREPLSEDEPAGPDLDEEADAQYFNYVLSADSRMPERYFTVDQATDRYVQFDGSTIDLPGEVSAIDALLRRTRDIRLLGFDARFNALAGNIVGCCEAIEGMAIIVSSMWPSFHPRPMDGDYIQRQNVIDGLDDQPRIIQPLQHANIAGGTRSRAVTYRNYLVATDRVPAREDEERVPLEEIARTISGLNQRGEPVEDLRNRVEEVYGAVQRALAAIALITQTFTASVDAEFVPNLKALPETLRGIADLITTYRRDLAPDGGAEEAAGEDEAGDVPAEGGGVRLPAGAVKSHGAARKALGAVERYLLFNEPSSPALVLVHQSRMLIGRPLVDALEALMPDESSSAALRFDAGYPFSIDLTRMRTVTEDALGQYQYELDAAAAEADGEGESETAESGSGSDDSGWGSSWDGWGTSGESTEQASGGETAGEEAVADSTYESEATFESEGVSESEGAGETTPDTDENGGSWDAGAGADDTVPPSEPAPEAARPPPPAPAAPAAFVANTRAEAADLISATESFFRTVEPSSPLPILLSKARGYLNRDFASILSELMPRRAEE